VRVYIAGPYTRGDRSDNVRHAMRAAIQLLDAGHEPFCPHLSHFLDLMEPRPWEEWMRLDMAWLPFADAIIRLQGDSAGADEEVRLAAELGIVVHSSVVDFLEDNP